MGDEHLVQQLARWAIRVAVTMYVCRIARELYERNDLAARWIPSRAVLLFSVAGCGFYLIHVALAFEGFHDWSHDAAVRFTAEETQRVLGIERGEGVWVNYAFTLIWIADCIRLALARHRDLPTKLWHDGTIHVVFAGMMFSATVVFGPSIYRWLALPVAVIWFAAWRASSGRDTPDVRGQT